MLEGLFTCLDDKDDVRHAGEVCTIAPAAQVENAHGPSLALVSNRVRDARGLASEKRIAGPIGGSRTLAHVRRWCVAECESQAWQNDVTGTIRKVTVKHKVVQPLSPEGPALRRDLRSRTIAKSSLGTCAGATSFCSRSSGLLRLSGHARSRVPARFLAAFTTTPFESSHRRIARRTCSLIWMPSRSYTSLSASNSSWSIRNVVIRRDVMAGPHRISA